MQEIKFTGIETSKIRIDFRDSSVQAVIVNEPAIVQYSDGWVAVTTEDVGKKYKKLYPTDVIHSITVQEK